MRKADGSAAASILVSPDRLGVTWLHLFASAIPYSPRPAWAELWPAAERILRETGMACVWAMTTQDWMIDLLANSGFVEQGRVVAYSQQAIRALSENDSTGSAAPMKESDLPEIEQLDHAAFATPWQMDSDALRATRERSLQATVLRLENRIAGYLMAAATPQGIHITRVAVHPDDQHKGIGRTLIIHLLNYSHRQGVPRITVNTQIENRRSERLYHSLGFTKTGESYPVFRYDLPPARMPSL